MMLKTLTAATLLALSSMALAQSTGATMSGSADVRTDTTTSSGGVDITKCAALMGTEREKCLLDQRSGAAGSGSASGSIGTTAPAPMTTPSSPTNPTTMPGSTMPGSGTPTAPKQ